LSVKKKQMSEVLPDKKTVDPAALVLLSHQVRAVLRFHQQIGLESYPAADCLGNFLQKRLPVKKYQRPVQSRREPLASPPPSMALSIEEVGRKIVACRECRLAEHRFGQVLGRGPDRPKLMVVGDWSSSEPFTPDIIFGQAEEPMFWRMMSAINLNPEQVYVTNVVKCCPRDSPPDSDCASQCFVHLRQEISALKPCCILAMGEVAVGQILATSTPLVRLRGRFHLYRSPDGSSLRVMPTYHPRFLLANQEMKKMAWMDLQMVQRLL